MVNHPTFLRNTYLLRQDVFNQYQINHHHGDRAEDTEDFKGEMRSKNVVGSLKRGKLYSITTKVLIISEMILCKKAKNVFFNSCYFRLEGVHYPVLGNLF